MKQNYKILLFYNTTIHNSLLYVVMCVTEQQKKIQLITDP